MLYKDLNLAKVRDDNDLDFAHFTFKKNQCSCCYGPKDMAKRYWKNNTIPEGDDYTYILFKNADNGSGCVKSTDTIKAITNVSWDFPIEKLNAVCRSLAEQFDDNFKVLVPCDKSHTITIIDVTREAEYYASELASGHYKALEMIKE